MIETYLLCLYLPLSEIKLSVHSVDLLSSKQGQNRKEHHTDLYHSNELIIRRGQTFQIELELNKPFNADTDKLHLDMKTGMVNSCIIIMISSSRMSSVSELTHLADSPGQTKVQEVKKINIPRHN